MRRTGKSIQAGVLAAILTAGMIAGTGATGVYGLEPDDIPTLTEIRTIAGETAGLENGRPGILIDVEMIPGTGKNVGWFLMPGVCTADVESLELGTVDIETLEMGAVDIETIEMRAMDVESLEEMNRNYRTAEEDDFTGAVVSMACETDGELCAG